MKKINETRRKAEKIMELRKENDRKYEEKMKEQMRQQRMLKKRTNQKYTGRGYRVILSIEEQDRQKNIHNKIGTIKSTRKAEAFIIRKCGKDNDRRKVQFRVRLQNLSVGTCQIS